MCIRDRIRHASETRCAEAHAATSEEARSSPVTTSSLPYWPHEMTHLYPSATGLQPARKPARPHSLSQRRSSGPRGPPSVVTPVAMTTAWYHTDVTQLAQRSEEPGKVRGDVNGGTCSGPEPSQHVELIDSVELANPRPMSTARNSGVYECLIGQVRVDAHICEEAPAGHAFGPNAIPKLAVDNRA